MIAHILKALISVQTASDGDWVDRLNHRFTAMILVVLGILVSTKQYVGKSFTHSLLFIKKYSVFHKVEISERSKNAKNVQLSINVVI